MKKRILWMSEFLCSTGFAQVSHNLVKRLMKKYDITIVAANYFGDPHDWPLKIYPAKKFNDPHPMYQDESGRQRVIDELCKGEYDIFFCIKDPFTIVNSDFGKTVAQIRPKLKFKWVYYYALDCMNPRKHWVDDGIGLADHPVAFTNWGKEEVLKVDPSLKIEVIYHGVDTDDFKPFSRQVKRRLKSDIFDTNKYIVTNVNRNINRKDFPKTLLAFKKFHDQVPESLLYIHARYDDLGGDFRLMAKEVGLKSSRDIRFPEMKEFEMPPVPYINDIYNASDMIVSTSWGEGWGLSTTEAFATKTPIVCPNNTSTSEIGAAGRSYLVDSGTDDNLWVNRGNEYFNIWSPVVDVHDMVDKMLECYKNKEKTQKQVDEAYKWVQLIKWDLIAKQWDDLFTKI